MGETIGGSHISALLLINNLKSPYQPIILLHKKGKLENYLIKKNIPYRIDNKLSENINKKRNNLIAVFEKIKFLKKEKIAIVHTNEINMHIKWLIPTFFSKAKHIWHQRTPGPNKSIFGSLLSSKVITVSKYNKKSFLPFVRRNMEVVYNPFVFSVPHNRITDKSIDNSNLHLGWIGNFHERKRLDIFLQLIHSLENKLSFTSIIAHIYGNPLEPVYSKAKAIIKSKKISSEVIFHGFLSNISEEFEKIDILVATPEKEAFGRTLVEAAANGVPVIANKEGGHIEIIDDQSGILIPENNVNEYAKAIVKIVENKVYFDQLKDKAYNRCKALFSVDIHVNQMIKIYNKITN